MDHRDLIVDQFTKQAVPFSTAPGIHDREALALEKGLGNVTWQVGDVLPLPFASASFSVVVCRFAFHHFLQPERVLAEMKRVCRPGGTVAVVDVVASADPTKACASNRMERLRDPSHVRALTLAELEAVFPEAGLPEPRVTFYRLESELEGLLERSFPDPGDVAEIRRMFEDSLADDGLGLGTRREGDRVRFAYPVAIAVSSTSRPA